MLFDDEAAFLLDYAFALLDFSDSFLLSALDAFSTFGSLDFLAESSLELPHAAKVRDKPNAVAKIILFFIARSSHDNDKLVNLWIGDNKHK